MFRKNTVPREPSTVDVGVEEKFYRDGELNVDEEITELEKTFARSVNQVRQLHDGSKITDGTLIEFIVNLTMRTKHLRDSLIDIGEFAVDKILGHFCDYQNAREFCIKLLTHQRDVLIKASEEHVKKVKPGLFTTLVGLAIVRYAPAKLLVRLLDSSIVEIVEAIQSQRAEITQSLDQIVKQAHIKTLLKNLVPEPRVDYYNQLYWYVRRSTEPLILGDVCCLFRVANSRYVSIAGPADGLDRVYLPIASDCVVVGSPKDEVPDIKVSELNEASARVSRNFFISAISSDEMIRLSNFIDTEADVLTGAEMEEIITEVLSEPFSNGRK